MDCLQADQTGKVGGQREKWVDWLQADQTVKVRYEREKCVTTKYEAGELAA